MHAAKVAIYAATLMTEAIGSMFNVLIDFASEVKGRVHIAVIHVFLTSHSHDAAARASPIIYPHTSN